MFNPMVVLGSVLKQFTPMIPELKKKYKFVQENCANSGSQALALENAEKDLKAGSELVQITAEFEGKPIRVLVLAPKGMTEKFSLT